MTALLQKTFGLSAEGCRRGLGDGMLLAAAIVCVIALVAVLAAIGAMLVAVMMALVEGQPWQHASDVAAWRPAGSGMLTVLALAVVAGGIGDVLQIIVTVAERRPFDPGNARRIERLAWRMIHLVLIGLLARVAALHVGGYAIGLPVLLGTGPDKLAFALVLFVLARVFQHARHVGEARLTAV